VNAIVTYRLHIEGADSALCDRRHELAPVQLAGVPSPIPVLGFETSSGPPQLESRMAIGVARGRPSSGFVAAERRCPAIQQHAVRPLSPST